MTIIEHNQARTSVKICGLMDISILRSIASLPMDQVGFVFAPSKRLVTPEQAAEMIAFIRQSAYSKPVPLTVGVFVNPTKEQLIATLAIAPLDVIQLHAEETPEFCHWVKENLKVQVYKVVTVSETSETAQHLALLQPFAEIVDAILLDTYDPIMGGGTGKAFAWHCIPDYLAWAHQNGLKLIVAGGLNSDNVAQLIAEFHPDGVDVSSGVETNGAKDAHKIKTFVERVKGI
ncbi:MAG: N-(5-phosphoribosyl)anthranilate isomerase [Bacilli bacterium]|nr:N-(5-phosphoribosyl)anthranilate isomerase [Bacilli bacterium]